MAKKISELTAMAALDAADVFPADDISATETKKVSVALLHDTPIAPSSTGSAWSIQPANRTGGAGRGVSVIAGGTTDANAGGTATVRGGSSASGPRGSVDVDAGTGASGGDVGVGTTNAETVSIGRADNTGTQIEGGEITLAAEGTTVARVVAPGGSAEQLLLAAGSAAAPALAGQTDGDTGVVLPGGDVLALATGGVAVSEQHREVQTNDASPTTLASLTLISQRAYWLEAHIVARAGDGSNRALYVRAALVYREGGGAVLQGSVAAIATVESDAAWDATIDVSGNDARVQVTGAAATAIKWACRLTYQAVG
jgi:hypothetical protein